MKLVALALPSGFLMQGQGRGAAQSGAFPLSCKKEEQGGELNRAITLTASVQKWSVSYLHFLLIKGRHVVKPQINEVGFNILCFSLKSSRGHMTMSRDYNLSLEEKECIIEQ